MEIRKPNRALNQLLRANAVEWQPLAEPGSSGVWVKVLRFDPYTAPNNVHAVHSKSGCVTLLNVPQEVEVLRGER